MTAGRHTAAALILVALAAPAPLGAQAGKPAPAAARAAPLSPAALVGRWGDNGDCAKDVLFRGDGTFRSYTGGEGTWRLAGNRLTMTGANGTFVRIVQRLGPRTIRITGPDGTGGLSQRC